MKNQQFTLQLESNSMLFDSQNDQLNRSTSSNNSLKYTNHQNKCSPISQYQSDVQTTQSNIIPPEKNLSANFLGEDHQFLQVKSLNQSYRSPKFLDSGLAQSNINNQILLRNNTDLSEEDEEEFNRKMNHYRDKIQKLRYTLSKDNIPPVEIQEPSDDQSNQYQPKNQLNSEDSTNVEINIKCRDNTPLHSHKQLQQLCDQCQTDEPLTLKNSLLGINQSNDNQQIPLSAKKQQQILQQQLEKKEIMLREMKEINDKMYQTLQETQEELNKLKLEKKTIFEQNQSFKVIKQQQDVLQKEIKIKNLENSQLKNENARLNERNIFLEEKWTIALKQLEEQENRNTRQRIEIEQLIAGKKELSLELSRLYNLVKESQVFSGQFQTSKLNQQNIVQDKIGNNQHKHISISIDQDPRELKINTKKRISATPNTKSQQLLNSIYKDESNLSCSFVKSTSNNHKNNQNSQNLSFNSNNNVAKQYQTNYQNDKNTVNFHLTNIIDQIMYLLGVNSLELIIQQISYLVRQKKEFTKFSQCITEMMRQCIAQYPKNVQQVNFKEAWKWIKGIAEEYYKCQAKLRHFQEENHSLKVLAKKLNEAIQCGLINGCQDLEGTLTKLNLKE